MRRGLLPCEPPLVYPAGVLQAYVSKAYASPG